jgi:hypothetical protein
MGRLRTVRPMDFNVGPSWGNRVAVLGDVGGHSHRLRRVLEKELDVVFDLPHRASPTGYDWWDVDVLWPEGLVVIQAGDLVHRGPDSAGVLQFVDRAMSQGVWHQVIGNHEQLYVGPRSFSWNEQLDKDSALLLNAWWDNDTLRPAAGIKMDDGLDVVVTHAGVTAGFDHHVLGRAQSATAAVEALNDLKRTRDPVLWRPGLMLEQGITLDAGPLWAEAGREVYASWVYELDSRSATFSQVHGHSSAFWWRRGTWTAPDRVRPHLKADTSTRHVVATIGDATLVGVDPCHDVRPSRVWGARVFDNATAF